MKNVTICAFPWIILACLAGTPEGGTFANAFSVVVTRTSYRSSCKMLSPALSSRRQSNQNRKQSSRLMVALPSGSNVSPQDVELAFWVAAFASSHIGMSAVRSNIIEVLGNLASPLIVNREGWTLPSWWPGDAVGKRQLFPTTEIAGRQLYRVAYTIVSFWTLGSAFLAYLVAAVGGQGSILLEQQQHDWTNFYLGTAALSFGASIASLFNASPLGLMPGFEASSGAVQQQPPASIVQRNDALKFTVRGLTRITRHPLILPVVPWGIATSYLAGGRLCDYILFSGLSAYAMAGCAAQDLRVSRNEGSVGTVFEPSAEEGEQLAAFFADTSFVPFGAVLDGRQPLSSISREFPWLAFFVGTGIGFYLEETILLKLGAS